MMMTRTYSLVLHTTLQPRRVSLFVMPTLWRMPSFLGLIHPKPLKVTPHHWPELACRCLAMLVQSQDQTGNLVSLDQFSQRVTNL